MIRAIAIDDEPEALEIIKKHASKLNEIELVGTFYKPEEAIQFLKNYPIDLIFLDINMPGISGIELIRTLKIKPLVVFITAYSQYAAESYKLDAVDYLLKPIDFEDFQISFKKVIREFSKNRDINFSENYIYIKDRTTTLKLFFADILFIKGCGNYVEFITKSNKYSTRLTITQLLVKLPQHIFIRVHNSHVINIDNIDKIEHNHISMEKHKIVIGEKYREAFNHRIKSQLL